MSALHTAGTPPKAVGQDQLNDGDRPWTRWPIRWSVLWQQTSLRLWAPDRAGSDIHVVQRLLGHASIAPTVGCTYLVLDDLRRDSGRGVGAP